MPRPPKQTPEPAPNRLTELEGAIAEAVEAVSHAYVTVGLALSEIRDSELYLQTHGTFEAYCLDRWQISRPRAYQFMAAAKVVSTRVDKSLPLPATEKQARELAPLPVDVAKEVWRVAVQEADGGQPTAPAIRQVADRFRSQRLQVPPSSKLQELLKTDPHPDPETLADVYPEMVMERSATMLRLPPTELDRLNELVRRRGYPSFQEYALSLVNADIKRHFKGERPFQSTSAWVETCGRAVETLERQKAAQAETFKRTTDQILAQGGGATASSKRRAKK